MIATRLTHFRTLLEARDRVRAGREAANQLAPVRSTLAELAGKLTPLAARFRLFRNQGILSAAPPDVVGLLRYAAELRERLAGPPNEVTGGQKQSYRRFTDAAEKVRDTLTELTTDAWKNWVADQAPQVAEDDLRLVEQLGGHDELVARIRALRDQCRTLAAAPPDTEELFAAARRQVTELQQAVAQLPDVTSDPEVRAFLRAVNAGGAALTLITPGVLRWLEQMGRADGFKVVRGTPAPATAIRR